MEAPLHDEMVISLLEHWEQCDGQVAGAWYRESRRVARSIAREHGVTVSRVAGIIAALSPQLQWPVNVRMAKHYVEHGSPGEGCLRLSDDRAYDIWRGARPLDVLRGPKTRAFYRAIMGDRNAAVVDTWMLKAVRWHRDGCSAAQYVRIEAALREAARRVGIDVSSFQAIVWIVVRGKG